MDISNIVKTKGIQPSKVKDTAPDPVRNLPAESNDKYISKSKVDRAEFSESYSGRLEDKKINVAKSQILYEVSVPASLARVQELKAAVEKGEYHVSSDVLADELLK
ncbi:MAG: flagellar biosynthesis anti-sigma factor FlgM [Anaerovoracaceae bacterium]